MPVAASTHRIVLVLQYLGTDFYGWQRQPAHRNVQQEVEAAITGVVGQPVTLHAAGRTDTGVHAAAQVAHFDTTAPIPAHRWASVLNARLPKDILVRGSAAVAADWHARFSAQWRRYRYTLYTDRHPNLFLSALTWHYYQQPLDVGLIQQALEPLIGKHHLAAFHRANSGRPHSWVDVQAASCQRQGALVEIEVQASGFLYGMMRLLVGLLVEVGIGQRSPASFTEIWQTEQRDQVKYAAPARGLCLLRVGYPDFPLPEPIWFETLPRLTLPELFAFPCPA
ncbi:MAG: tRNA pseudouridine(38-40) synthase TruA [Aphanocapsa sp. GSE-SYN-MK-11-07L]|nr:tRNA pseudouridine(38-40) synthase TruA [Aphanocapsa sp. GSE-SYN-MK-11-07L]